MTTDPPDGLQQPPDPTIFQRVFDELLRALGRQAADAVNRVVRTEPERLPEDIWDCIEGDLHRDIPYVPSASDRRTLPAQRQGIWDFFFPLAPEHVGLPHARRIDLLQRELQESRAALEQASLAARAAGIARAEKQKAEESRRHQSLRDLEALIEREAAELRRLRQRPDVEAPTGRLARMVLLLLRPVLGDAAGSHAIDGPYSTAERERQAKVVQDRIDGMEEEKRRLVEAPQARESSDAAGGDDTDADAAVVARRRDVEAKERQIVELREAQARLRAQIPRPPPTESVDDSWQRTWIASSAGATSGWPSNRRC